MEAAVREVVVGLVADVRVDLRSDVVGFVVVASLDVAPVREARLAVPVMPDFLLSSPELRRPLPLSSAELLMDTRERCDEVVPEVVGLRAVEVVVVGRIGGLFRVLPVRAAVLVVFVAPVVEVDPGRLAVVPVTRRLVVVLAGFFGEAVVVFSLEIFGLAFDPSPSVGAVSAADGTSSTGV